MNNPLVPTPERDKNWWECSKKGCDFIVQATEQPEPHDRHPTAQMRPIDLSAG